MPAPVGVGLADENLRRADRAADQHHQRADRPRARHQNRAAARDLCAVDAVERDGGRLDHRALLVRDVIGNRVCVVVIDDRQFAHAAPGPAQTDAAHARAQMIEAATAVVIVERHDERLNGDAVALAHAGHRTAGLQNLGREFVTENLRQHRAGEFVRGLWRYDRAAGEFMEVRAANPAGERAHQDLTVAHDIRRRHIVDANIFLGVKPDGLHLSLQATLRFARCSGRATPILRPDPKLSCRNAR